MMEFQDIVPRCEHGRAYGICHMCKELKIGLYDESNHKVYTDEDLAELEDMLFMENE